MGSRLRSSHNRRHHVPGKAISWYHSRTDHRKKIPNILTSLDRLTTFHRDTLRQMSVNQGSWALEVPHPYLCYYKNPTPTELGTLGFFQYVEHMVSQFANLYENKCSLLLPTGLGLLAGHNTKPEDINSVPWTHMVEREDRFLQAIPPSSNK